MKKLKKIATGVVASLTMSVAGLLAFEAPAFAMGGGVHGPAESHWGSGWYAIDLANDVMSLSVYPKAMSPGYCLTTWVDILRQAGTGGYGTHYDIRAVRSCRSNENHYSGAQYEGATYGTNIIDRNRVFVCYGPENASVESGQTICRVAHGTASGVSQYLGPENDCARAWVNKPSGTNAYYSGGVSSMCEDYNG